MDHRDSERNLLPCLYFFMAGSYESVVTVYIEIYLLWKQCLRSSHPKCYESVSHKTFIFIQQCQSKMIHLKKLTLGL